MLKFRFVVFLVAGLSLISSCASRKNKLEKMRLECSERLSRAVQTYNSRKYTLALTRFEDVRTQCGGSPMMDTVQFYLGMANLKAGKYIEARSEFQRLVQDYPGSSFFEESKFRIGYSVFKQSNPVSRDQKETKEAIRLLDNFLELYPRSPFADSALYYRTAAYEKLAEKDFNNARFYEKINEPEAAVVYYRAFIEKFSDSKFTDQARLNLISLLIKLNRLAEADETYRELLDKGKNKKIKEEAKQMFAKAKK